MIKLNKYYQQIILACKGWANSYSINNTIERIISQYARIDRKYINQNHVYNYLVEILEKVDPESLNRIYKNMFCDRDSISMHTMIKKLMSALATIKVVENGVELIELEYDETIMNGICGSEV